MAAPATAPTKTLPVTRLAEATEVLAAARARVVSLQRILGDPGAGRLAHLHARRDLLEAEIAEEDAQIAMLELVEEAKAARLRRRAELHALHDPAVREAATALHETLERVRDTEFAALLRALDVYMAELGETHPGAADLAWPPIFLRPEGSGEDQVTFRARWLRANGYLT